jgi:hypothetical protein
MIDKCLFILGMVLANDANRERCKAVVGNLHRWVPNVNVSDWLIES